MAFNAVVMNLATAVGLRPVLARSRSRAKERHHSPLHVPTASGTGRSPIDLPRVDIPPKGLVASRRLTVRFLVWHDFGLRERSNNLDKTSLPDVLQPRSFVFSVDHQVIHSTKTFIKGGILPLVILVYHLHSETLAA